MSRFLPVSVFVVVFVGSILTSRASAAGAWRGDAVPPSLRPWIPWVLSSPEGKEAGCPVPYDETSAQCVWPSRLTLALHGKGGTFTQDITLYREGPVWLPGDGERWPSGVMVGGKRVLVSDGKDEPIIYLPAGSHTVTGRFLWDVLPESLRVPEGTALVSLAIDGKNVPAPDRDSDGRLFLGPGKEQKADPDRVEIAVFRKLTDGAPVLLQTLVELTVSGKNREVRLGRVLPDGFEATRFETLLPLRLDESGHAVVQAKSGTHSMTLHARRNASVSKVARPDPDGLWVEGHEAWVFEEQPEFRRASVSGAPVIDPAQTRLPPSWRSLPAFAVGPGAALTFTVRDPGQDTAAPDRVHLRRTVWLDGDGGGYSASDEISGTFRHTTRLDSDGSLRLGRVVLDGADTFITRLGSDGRAGVELPAWRSNLRVEGRFDGGAGFLPANGYARSFDDALTVVHVPPGYRLLHATGMDEVRGTWLSEWSVMDLCLSILCVLGTVKVFGARAGLGAALVLALLFFERDTPRVAWLLVLGGELLRRFLSDGKFAVVARWLRPALFLVLGYQVFVFALARLTFVAAPPSMGAAGEAAPPEWLKKSAPPERMVNFMVAAQEPGRDMPTEHTLGALVGREMGEGYGLAGMGTEGTSGFGNFGTLGRGGGETGSGYARRHKGEEGRMGKKTSKEGLYGLKGPKDPPTPPPAPQQAKVEYDPSVRVQTGFGLPVWSAPTAELAFQAPLREGRRIRLFLLPPWATRALALLQGVALVMLARSAWRRTRGGGVGTHLPAPTVGVAAILILFALAPSSASAQEIPSDETLSTLRQRVQPEPACRPHCASIDEMGVSVDADEVRVRLRGSALAPTAIALPTDGKTWSPTQVLVGGVPARALRIHGGEFWVSLPTGFFTVELRGPTLGRDSIQLPMRMAPHRVKVAATGYTVDGVHEDGAVDESVQLSRVTSGAALSAQASTPTLPAFLQVSREITLGLKWQVRTVVTRQGDSGVPVVAEIPLLPGEAVSTPRLRVDAKKRVAAVNLGPLETRAEWEATLAEAPSLRLWFDPATASLLSERWSVDVHGTWHATFSGRAPLAQNQADPHRQHVFHPYPGDEVRIDMVKPTGAPGPTLTVEESTLTLSPGDRLLVGSLQFVARTTLGTTHAITLPEGATVESIRRGGESQPLQLDGRVARVTLSPGKQTVEVDFRIEQGLSTYVRTPAVDLGVPSVNHRTVWNLPSGKRFILWLAGPSGGPQTHLGILLLGVVLAAIRLRRAPLGWGFFDWLLLLVGFSLVGWVQTAGLIACLVFLGWRCTLSLPESQYNASQVAVGVGLVLALGTWLLAFTDRGFLLPPSTLPWLRPMGASLQWFHDRAAGPLPRPWMISLPMWAYHGMLLFLGACFVWRLPRLARLVWQALARGGLWKQAPAQTE